MILKHTSGMVTVFDEVEEIERLHRRIELVEQQTSFITKEIKRIKEGGKGG